ncbi:futalosine hydrolase [Longimicrobium terrae]|uniref:Futalosine hydrolase n=1 Tax=Longimicrobium terrae TaxID=1639882 RepID=A0A841H2F9_9BACT|nr:futalosine hydrolase [Longimicrobium terrae]MBB4637917.1 futalosine hydrolase [Longimicrobium terrae]MBB6072164.1 futalosine hydrolase [Longimicrobium terrae]NNC28409.1 futalosine hydrolase [Longimicrobium terrae]
MNSHSAPLALICSVPFECARLVAALDDGEPVVIGRKDGWTGRLGGTPVIILPGGMGKTNVAHAATALLETRAVSGLVGFGIGGAYPGSGLSLGDVALATHAVYGDEGVQTPDGWIGTDAIGIPLWRGEAGPVFNDFALDQGLVDRARAALAWSGCEVRTGPFVTVSACSGTDELGRERAERFGALCEGMEGAALAHVCAIYGVPFLEVRAVSNHVEDRDMSRWRIAPAVEAAQDAVLTLAGAWPRICNPTPTEPEHG